MSERLMKMHNPEDTLVTSNTGSFGLRSFARNFRAGYRGGMARRREIFSHLYIFPIRQAADIKRILDKLSGVYTRVFRVSIKTLLSTDVEEHGEHTSSSE